MRGIRHSGQDSYPQTARREDSDVEVDDQFLLSAQFRYKRVADRTYSMAVRALYAQTCRKVVNMDIVDERVAGREILKARDAGDKHFPFDIADFERYRSGMARFPLEGCAAPVAYTGVFVAGEGRDLGHGM